ncbi:tRNA-splicing endonuclease [Clarias magur]|uniref:tRNA-splicing endonuclease n=1 Tax=Clarias magur TaxID=1594786 RepID=A0A8J4WVJ0_CLAMG|nr:tRNA-splicing endonuclease [Clarias magur]
MWNALEIKQTEIDESQCFASGHCYQSSAPPFSAYRPNSQKNFRETDEKYGKDVLKETVSIGLRHTPPPAFPVVSLKSRERKREVTCGEILHTAGARVPVRHNSLLSIQSE